MKWITAIWTRARDMWSYRHEPEYLQVLTDIYWRTLLFVMMFVILWTGFYGAFKFLSALAPRDGATVLLQRGGSAILNRADLQATLDGFAARETHYEFLKKNLPKIPDPSR